MQQMPGPDSRRTSDNSSIDLALTIDWLDGLGFEVLTEPQKTILLKAAFEAMEEKVGLELTANLPNELVDEFGAIIDHPDAEVADTRAEKWLQDNLPGYRHVVRRVRFELEQELLSISTDFTKIRGSTEQVLRVQERQPNVTSPNVDLVESDSTNQNLENLQSHSLENEVDLLPNVEGGRKE